MTRLHSKSSPRLTGLLYLADRATRLGGSPHLSCKCDQNKRRNYIDRRVTPPWRVTSPTWGPPPSCKQALKNVLLVCQEERRASDTVLFTSENNDIANQSVDTSFFTSEKIVWPITTSSLARRDYFYLDAFWRVNLGRYIIIITTIIITVGIIIIHVIV